MKQTILSIVVVISCVGIAGCGDSSTTGDDTDDTNGLDVTDDADSGGADSGAVDDTADPADVAPDGMTDSGELDDDTAAPASCWRTLSPVRGGPVQEHGVVALKGRIYVVAGLKNLFEIVDAVHAYLPSDDTWTTVAPLPAAVHHPNTAVAGDRIYVLGALSGPTFAAIGDAWVYDDIDDSWTSVTAMPAARRRGASAVTVIDEDIYLVGGFRGSAQNEVSVFDTTTLTYTSLAPLPIVADHLVAEAAGGKVYAIGGRDTAAGIDDVVGNVWIYTPNDDTWRAGAPMPTARAGCMSGVLDGRIVVVGGEGNPNHPQGVFPEVESYDPLADTWETLAPMTTARHGTGAATLDGVLYVPGGADTGTFGAVDVFEALTCGGRLASAAR